MDARGHSSSQPLATRSRISDPENMKIWRSQAVPSPDGSAFRVFLWSALCPGQSRTRSHSFVLPWYSGATRVIEKEVVLPGMLLRIGCDADATFPSEAEDAKIWQSSWITSIQDDHLRKENINQPVQRTSGRSGSRIDSSVALSSRMYAHRTAVVELLLAGERTKSLKGRRDHERVQ